ncbi:hypothetical protein DFQ29_009406 [Apophysomyces sp. BC1021]|nr:hypothetical protein DFQ29_009406 [Apophysomyces sp. BC1021]
MFEHNGKSYNYRNALRLKYPEGVPIAEVHNTRETTISMKFDTVADASGFSKDVFQGTPEQPVFIAAQTFLHPRSSKGLPPDYSERCTIM